jgi:hypothetical protein
LFLVYVGIYESMEYCAKIRCGRWMSIRNKLTWLLR